MSLFLLSVLFFTAAGASPASPGRWIQDPPKQEESPAAKPAEKPPAAPPEKEKQEKETGKGPAYLAVVGADLYTVSSGVIHGGTLLCQDGRILKVGKDVVVPEGAEVIAAAGMHVYPGLVAVNASGIVSGRAEELKDSFDPYALNVDLALAGGLTTVQSNDAVAKLTRGTLEGALLAARPWITLNYASSAPGNRRKLREGLDLAREFLRRRAAWEREQEERKAKKPAGGAEQPQEKGPEPKGVNEEHLRLLRGEATARFTANSLPDLLAICELLERYPMDAVIQGGQEAWICADRLGRCGARLVLTPRAKRWEDETLNRASGWSIENAAKLHAAGVEFAILPGQTFISLGGIAGRDLLTLPLEAAFAIRGGLPQETALRALTLNAARILGVEERIGSLDAGKDADFIITDGDLFDYRTFVQWAVVNGKVAYDKQKAPYFAHIRPRPAPPELQEVVEQVREALEEAPEQGGEPKERKPDDPEGGG